MKQKSSPLVSTDTLLGLTEAGKELGIPVDKEICDAGLDPDLLSVPQSYLPISTVALLLQVSPNVETALTYGHRFIGLVSEATRWNLSIKSDSAIISRTDLFTFDTDLTQLHLLSVTQYIQLMRAFCGSRWHPSNVYFTHRPPKGRGYYRKAYQCPVHFEQTFNGFEFPAIDLKTSIPTYNASILESVLEHLESLEKEKGGDDLYSKTNTFLRQCMGTSMCNLIGASSYLGVHPKSLQRELLAHGHTFQEMLLDARQEIAIHYLENTDISLKQLAALLGYSDPAPFSRAFKKASGMSPRAYRNNLI